MSPFVIKNPIYFSKLTLTNIPIVIENTSMILPILVTVLLSMFSHQLLIMFLSHPPIANCKIRIEIIQESSFTHHEKENEINWNKYK